MPSVNVTSDQSFVLKFVFRWATIRQSDDALGPHRSNGSQFCTNRRLLQGMLIYSTVLREAFCAGLKTTEIVSAPSRTPLGELTTLLQTP